MKVDTLNGQTVTVVTDPATGTRTLRIAKDGHNRAVAKLDPATAALIGAALMEGK